MKTEKRRRALVVDDDLDFGDLLKAMLGELGFEVQVAHNGEDALTKLNARPPNIITLDIQMANHSGIWFYQQIRSHENYGHIPVIVISGLPPKTSEWKQFMTAYLAGQRMPGQQAYLNKPVEISDLDFTIKRTLRSELADF